MKYSAIILLGIVILTVFTVTILSAQPSMPSDPSQAPLGSFWLIATSAVGLGLWALQRFRNKN